MKKIIDDRYKFSSLTACSLILTPGNPSSASGHGGRIGRCGRAGAGTLLGGNDLQNAGWGALAGGVVGAAVGAYMDHQQQEMQQSLPGTGIEVQRTAENTLNLTMA